jgi:predicted dehydrogenase
MKKKSQHVSRRGFLAATGAAMAVPFIAPASALGLGGAVAPSERITIGTIGSGSMGSGNTRHIAGQKDAHVVSVCDVDKSRVQNLAKDIDKRQKSKGCRTYSDYRELLQQKDIDAVIIATPDHWHGICAIAAANAKKDIYCQKPVVHTFAEGQALVKATAKNKVVFQVGSQQRSHRNFRKAAELVANGVIGKIKRVEVGLPTGHKQGKGEDAEPPANIDYNFWCGPSEMLPYVKNRLHWNWRWHLSYGGGQLMDWIGHHNDIAHWGLGLDKSGPIETKALGFEYPKDRRVWNSAWKYEVLSKYEGGYEVSISNGNKQGCKWIGEDGWVFVSRGAFRASDPNWMKKDFDAGKTKLYNSPEHHRNFLNCIKTRKECICPAETGHRSITPGHLGLVSEALGGRTLKWDPKKETIIGDAEADKLLKKVDFRKPWVL